MAYVNTRKALYLTTKEGILNPEKLELVVDEQDVENDKIARLNGEDVNFGSIEKFFKNNKITSSVKNIKSNTVLTFDLKNLMGELKYPWQKYMRDVIDRLVYAGEQKYKVKLQEMHDFVHYNLMDTWPENSNLFLRDVKIKAKELWGDYAK